MQLPTPIIRYADAVLRGEDLEQTTSALRVHLKETSLWLKSACDFPISAPDADALAAAQTLLEEMNRLLNSQILTPEESSRRLLETAALLEANLVRLRLARSRTYLVQIPGLDGLLVAGIAVLQKRASADALPVRLAGAWRDLEYLVQESQRRSHQQAQQDRTDRQAALAELRQALETLAAGGRLKPTMKLLLTASKKLEPLYLACQERDGCRSGITTLDEILGGLLRAAAIESEPVWAETIDGYLEAGHTGLEQAWSYWEERALLPGRLRPAVRHRIERYLEELRTACKEKDRERVTQAARRLERALQRLPEHTLALEQAVGTVLESPVQALAAAYRQTMPELMLLEVARAFADPTAPTGTRKVHRLLLAFLGSANRTLLLEALEVLLEVVQEMNRPGYALQGLVCRCCGQPYNPTSEQNWCGQPGRAHRFLSVCA